MSGHLERAGADAWIWPRGLGAPAATGRSLAGDLPIRHPAPDAIRTGTLLGSLRDGHRDLAAIAVDELVRTLGRAGEALASELDAGTARSQPDTATQTARHDRGRSEAGILEIAANGRLSPEMARAVVGGMVPSWRARALDRLVAAEFPDREVLDGFAPEKGPPGQAGAPETGRLVRAAAPPVTLHFGAGSVPGVTVTSMIRALLVKSAVLVKPGAGDIALTVRFARLLHRADPRLARAVAVQYWPGGAPEWDGFERGLLRGADQVVVYGGDATIEAIRARAPASTRLIEHPHRIGVAIVDPGAAPPGTAAVTARAVSLFEQRGCVSTHLVLLLGTAETAAQWCAELARALAAAEDEIPAGSSTPGELSARHQLLGRLALKAAASGDIRVWTAETGSWSTVLAPPGAFEAAGGRTVWVAPTAGPAEALRVLSSLSPALQTVGLAGVGAGVAEALHDMGATRIVPLDQVPFPQPDWFHDGSRPLHELVRWGELR